MGQKLRSQGHNLKSNVHEMSYLSKGVDIKFSLEFFVLTSEVMMTALGNAFCFYFCDHSFEAEDCDSHTM